MKNQSYKIHYNYRIIIFLVTLILCANVLTAIFSEGYYHPDEHFQVIEFLNYKIHKESSEAFLFWFQKEIRSWIQMFIYYVSYRVFLEPFSVTNPFSLAAFFRLESMIFALSSQVFFLWVSKDLWNFKNKFLFVSFFSLVFWPVVFLNVRTSQENFSAALLCLACACFIIFQRLAKKDVLTKRLRPHWLALFSSAICFGLAFQFRYQIIFFIFGVSLWLLFFSTQKLKTCFVFACGFILPQILCLFIDRWGYGHFVLPYVNNFNLNVLQRYAVKCCGVSPWYAYNPFYLNYLTYFIGAPFIFLFVYSLRSSSKNFLVWGIAAFVIFHVITPHKEIRFLFPIVFLTSLFVFSSAYDISIKIKENFHENQKLLKIIQVVFCIFFLLPNFYFLLKNIAYPANKDFAAFKFLQEKIPTDYYYGTDFDLQCEYSGSMTNNYCQMKRGFYLTYEKKFLHITDSVYLGIANGKYRSNSDIMNDNNKNILPKKNSMMSQIDTKYDNEKDIYIYFNQYGLNFLDKPSYYEKCPIVFSSLNFGFLKKIAQSNILRSILKHERITFIVRCRLY